MPSTTKTPTNNAPTPTTYVNRRQVYGHCFACLRPKVDCFCDLIPDINNRTSILILQHRRERQHRFNTVRIVERALQNCQVIIGYAKHFQQSPLPIQPGAGLLYPGAEATVLAESPAIASGKDGSSDNNDREQVAAWPTQLVILDGTWGHTKKFVRVIEPLHALPRYRLAPASPGRYRIREEPDQHALSTLEATVAALQVIEPTTEGFDQLTRAFDHMTETQWSHPCNPHRPGGIQA